MKAKAKCKKQKAEWDWRDIIARGKAGRLGADEEIEAEERAGEWPTCACGYLCDRLPRLEDGMPGDLELQEIGLSFCAEVTRPADWDAAGKTFAAIETRTATLLKARMARISRIKRKAKYHVKRTY